MHFYNGIQFNSLSQSVNHSGPTQLPEMIMVTKAVRILILIRNIYFEISRCR